MQIIRGTTNGKANTEHHVIDRLINSVCSAVVIDPDKLRLIVAALLAQGHVLLEDVPGIGKTLVAKALAKSLHGSFKRIQCAPDLLPSDITGGSIYNQREQTFEFVPGPIFANIVLVDEINRASPRTQSSLLEGMGEGQVTSDGVTRALERPFFIIATQNPVEMAGTFPLPEAQLDRFLVAMSFGYPSFDDEVSILEREEHNDPLEAMQPVITIEEIIALQKATKAVEVSRALKEYMVSLVTATRTHADVVLGVSPRGGAALQRCAQALAVIRERSFVTPDDIKTAAAGVMPHRIMARDRRVDTARAVVEQVLKQVKVPVD